ncbi:hypothetical protein RclHR1_09620003 [Rhizophagus clarus]|uniref:Uncharacterized protein n=1 Tax=Rhizophagus clarus TaxID=94130 RepID=A0A2Z6SI03_9GLOM|nr:hypothetical protein RclHR1_09620003 [Rhizophagus clarus]
MNLTEILMRRMMIQTIICKYDAKFIYRDDVLAWSDDEVGASPIYEATPDHGYKLYSTLEYLFLANLFFLVTGKA